MRDFATRVVILADGVVVEEGPPAKVLTNPQHPATRFLLQMKERATPARSPRRARPASAREGPGALTTTPYFFDGRTRP